MDKPGLIFQLIPKIMREVGAIEKSRRNPQQGYAFRGIDDLYNAIQSHFADNGVFCSPEVVDQDREERETRNGAHMIYTVLRVKHTFYAADGSNFTAVTVGEAMDSGDKSANKAMSAAMKYALIEVFAIPTEGDNDTENDTPQVKGAAKSPAKPGPAPVVAQMSAEDAAKAGAELDQAWEAAGFDFETGDQLTAKALKQQKFPNLIAAGRPFVDRMLQNIRDGKYDKFKRTAAAAS